MPRFQAFAKGAAWLRTEDPQGYRKLAARIRGYERAAGVFGPGEGEIPPRYEKGATFRYILMEGALLLLGAPFAAVGTLVWLPVYFGLRPIVRRINPKYEAVSTYKLSSAASLSPLNILLWSLLAGFFAGWPWAVFTAAALVPLGLFALSWHERWKRVREDVGLFFRVASRPDRLQRLSRRRKALVEEFDRIGAAMEMGEEAGE